MRLAIMLLLICGSSSLAQSKAQTIPASTTAMLNQRFPGWKFAEVSREVQQFFKDEMKGASPVVITGDFDGDRRLDYAALITRGFVFNSQGQSLGPRHYLVVFLRRTRSYKMHVIRDPNGEYIFLAKKGTRDYNYNRQKEITYANDAILTGIFEKAGSSYIYKNGRFISFISSD